MAAQNLIDARIAKALGHPLRSRILAVLDEREASPSELAAEFSEPLANVAYHVRTLHDLDLVQLVRQTPRRGAIEHHYRAIARPLIIDADWAALPVSARRSVVGGVLTEISERVRDAARVGAFDQPGVRVSITNVRLDEHAWERLGERVEALRQEALELEARATQSLRGGTAAAGHPAALVLMMFGHGG